MSEHDAIFYKYAAEEFVIVNFKTFQVTRTIRIPGEKLDCLAITQVPRGELLGY